MPHNDDHAAASAVSLATALDVIAPRDITQAPCAFAIALVSAVNARE